MSAGSVPSVSIITPAYNAAHYIEGVVESVVAQAYPDKLEYIVLDDGSTDDTLARLEKYRGRIRLISHANMGEQNTVNKGVDLARHDIVAIVNADDPILPGLVTRAAGMLGEHPELVGVYPDWDMIDAEGKRIRTMQTLDWDYAILLEQHLCIPGPGVFFRKSVLCREPVRNPAYRFSGDFDLWLRLGLKGPMARIPEVLATWRSHDAGASHACRTPEMAMNMIQVMQDFFCRRDLPQEWRAKRRQALSTAYYGAGLMSLDNPDIPGRRLMLKSILIKTYWNDKHFIPNRRRHWTRILYIMGRPFTSWLWTWLHHGVAREYHPRRERLE
jgi:glycosyltransferase involved in cell wall biosynthesis